MPFEHLADRAGTSPADERQLDDRGCASGDDQREDVEEQGNVIGIHRPRGAGEPGMAGRPERAELLTSRSSIDMRSVIVGSGIGVPRNIVKNEALARIM